MKGQANAYSHTHCQTAQANPQTQVWQRVCLSNRTTKMVLKNFPTLQKNKKRHAQPDRQMTQNPTTTMVYRHRGQERQQLTAVWRNGGGRGKLNSSFSNQHLCMVDSLVLRNPPLRQAAKR
jgi:hypothetical protein